MKIQAIGLLDLLIRPFGHGCVSHLQFIDEGFGSLSSDKLAEVLDVLDKLRENGRILGIVTHLEDMKTQIPLRLEVYRTDDGSSKTRMVVGGVV